LPNLIRNGKKEKTMGKNYINVFVYGTLLRGLWNNPLLQGAYFMGRAETVNKYTLFVNGLLPMVDKDFKTSTILGELYKVDNDTLKNLDILEGHPDVYKREIIDVFCEDTGTAEMAFIYFLKDPVGEVEYTGDYIGYLIKYIEATEKIKESIKTKK